MEQTDLNNFAQTEPAAATPAAQPQNVPVRQDAQPVSAQPAVSRAENKLRVDATVELAFSKCLAAAIMAGFPICSIIAIFMGRTGLSLVKQANDMAAYYGVPVSGKNTAAKVLGKVGVIAGGVLTGIYAIYAVIYFFYFLLIFSLPLLNSL